MKYIFDIPDNVDYGVLTCRTSNGYYEYDFDGADFEKLPPAQPEPMKIDLSRCSEENWERIKKEWANTPITTIAAPPERIKGHWIKISPANIYECSECGKSVMTNDICAYDFCHGCGAEMEVTT
jgi:ribosomal protein L32